MNSQSVSVTFPISFLNSCLNVIGVATRANDSDGKTPGYDATSISKTGFICTNGTNHLVNLNMRYLAILLALELSHLLRTLIFVLLKLHPVYPVSFATPIAA